jgi:exopolyphosphatase/guanosine-5'-triphosphate,3'-diphosphate pyrophosphatase
VSKKAPEIVAAVDLGSNSFHMIVCSYNNGSLQIIDRLKEMVRLASGLDKKNLLDAKTQERALSCLERFGQRIRDFPMGNVRVVGTNTLRTAKNAQQFLLKAEQALNYPIHIISGIEEARLIYMGVAYSLGGNGDKRFVMDIGGGSTEYIIGSGNTPLKKESLNMGCVSVSNQFFKDGRLSKSALTQATLFAEQRLEPFEKDYHRKHWQQAIGASGSLRSIAKVLQAKNWSNNGITRDGLEQLVAYMNQCNHVDDLNLPELDTERLPVFAGGVAIIYATFKSLHIEQMTVSEGALREGLILDLLGRLYDDDIRSTTVRALTERYHTDREHSGRIQQTISAMLTQLDNDIPLFKNNSAVQFLNWAAALHEIGMDIAHSQYHKHSVYIIENGDLAGFSSQDQKILAAVVKAHRRKFSKVNFSDLPAPWHDQGIYLSVILRLAVVLHRNRYEQPLPDFKIALAKTKIRLQFPKDYLLQLPLTHADLIQEADYLKSAGFKLEFS